MSENVDPAKPFDGHKSPDLSQLISLLRIAALLIPGTADDRIIDAAAGLLTNPALSGLVNSIVALLGNLVHGHATATLPAPGVVPVPVTTPATVPVVPAVAPVAPQPTTVVAGDIAALKGKLYFVELPPRVTGKPRGSEGGIEGRERFQEIQAGANIHADSWLHCDVDPIGDNGVKYETGDARWAGANRWAPNGNPIWLYYEWNGQSTLEGHHAEEVEPGSVEDDLGCTPTYKITGPGKFRFGFQYLRHDGRMVDSGLIGQGNVPGGEPFNISQG